MHTTSTATAPIHTDAVVAGIRMTRTTDRNVDAVVTYGHLEKSDRTDSKHVNLPVKGTAFLANRTASGTVKCARQGCAAVITAATSRKQGVVFPVIGGGYAHGAHRVGVTDGGKWDAVNIVLTCGLDCNAAVDVTGGENIRSDWFFSPLLADAATLTAVLPVPDPAATEAKARQRVRAAG